MRLRHVIAAAALALFTTSCRLGDSTDAGSINLHPNTTGGTDSSIIPLTCHDFAVTPDGSDIIAQINAAGFFRAS